MYWATGTKLNRDVAIKVLLARGAVGDRRADVWSFGVVFYEMLTGRRMFGCESISDTLAAVLKTDPDWTLLPAETPPAIRSLLRRCLERDRKRRLAHIGDARLELDEAPEALAQSLAPESKGVLRAWQAGAAITVVVNWQAAVKR